MLEFITLSLFNKQMNAKQCFLNALKILAAWMAFSLFVVLAFASEPSLTSSDNVGQATANLLIGILLVPLVENFLFIRALDYLSSSQPTAKTALVAAAVAATLHFSWRAVAAFGLFFVISAIYITYRDNSQRFAFWGGVGLHMIFNLPGSALAFMYASGVLT